MTRAEELAAIARHIQRKGVTRCPTAHAGAYDTWRGLNLMLSPLGNQTPLWPTKATKTLDDIETRPSGRARREDNLTHSRSRERKVL